MKNLEKHETDITFGGKCHCTCHLKHKKKIRPQVALQESAKNFDTCKSSCKKWGEFINYNFKKATCA